MRLADRNGFVLFISSPNGSNAFRKKENEFTHLIKNGSKEHAVYHLTTWDNPLIPRSELEELKRTMPEAKYKQEVMAEYQDEQGLVYFEFTDNAVVPTAEPPARIMTGLDWGLDDNAASAWVNIHVDGTLHLSKEYVVNNTAPQDTAARIKQLTPTFPNAYVMDASCWRREGTSMTSIADVYAKAGVRAFQATRALDVSIGYVKKALSTGLLTIDPSCVNTITAMQEWQHGQHEPDILAALRYAIAYIFEFNLSPMANALKVAVSEEHFKAQLASTRNNLSVQPEQLTSVMLKPGMTQKQYDRAKYGPKHNRKMVWAQPQKWARK
jgi:hypothetical protein